MWADIEIIEGAIIASGGLSGAFNTNQQTKAPSISYRIQKKTGVILV